MDLIKHAVEDTKREPRYAYVAPTYTQAKDVAWSYLREYTAQIPGIEAAVSELSVTFAHNKARIRLYGAENYDRLRGLYLDGVVIDEAGDIDPRAWPEVIRPALSDRQGWATFIGTPRGRNDFHKLFLRSKAEADWLSLELKASKTGLIAEAELDDARRTLTPEQYAQEYECSFNAAVLGAYFGREVERAESEKRICRVPHDSSADVFACWDLGIGDATAIWIGQICGFEWHWIRYYEHTGTALDKDVDWIKALPYAVHTHYLPHDAEAREKQTGMTTTEFLEERGLNCEVVPRANPIDRITAVQLKFSRFWFDETGCSTGIEALRMYRAHYDEKRKTLDPKPFHDWASHGADAFGCGVMGADEKRMKITFAEPSYDWVA